MNRFCLKSGIIMDGTGEQSYVGDVLVENGRIKCVSKTPLEVDCPVIDCSGKVIAPGFIDAHSHQDGCIYYQNDLPYVEPFIRQGITTYVTGNCGVSAAGVLKGSVYGPGNSFLPPVPEGEPAFWNTHAEYFDYLRKKWTRQNIAHLAGHGTALNSVVGATPKGPTSPEDKKKVLAILEEGLDAGCKGISFGLGYRPGTFVPDSEIREMAEIAIKRNKLITVHSRVLGAWAPDIYGDQPGEPHNIRWHRDFINMFRDTGARLQISHLLFVGRQAWPTYDTMFEMIQDFLDNGGMDLAFDMYSYCQGGTSIAIMIPQVFYDNLPEIYESKELTQKLQEALEAKARDRGIRDSDVILCNPVDPELEQYRGLDMETICKQRNMTLAELYMDLYRRTEGGAGVYLMIEQDEAKVPLQMTHPKAMYMTDAWFVPDSAQNPCAYGSMVRFLRICRETKNQTMEQTVAHMTGLTAKRFDLFGRGFLRDGYFADIVVFDPETVSDTATIDQPESYAKGIEHVFINGEHVLDHDHLDASVAPGMVL